MGSSAKGGVSATTMIYLGLGWRCFEFMRRKNLLELASKFGRTDGWMEDGFRDSLTTKINKRTKLIR